MIEPKPLVWLLRVVAALTVLMLVLQGLTAGRFLADGSVTALDLHGAGSIVFHVLAGAQTVVAGLLWRPARAALWPAVFSALVFGLSFVQAWVGTRATLDVHLPLAMMLLAATAWVATWAWITRPWSAR